MPFGTPAWYDAVRFAAAEADRLGLEMAIFSSPGWSETGGPWVRPEQAMKKLVWSETTITGPVAFSGKLPAPPSTTGPIRNVPVGGGGAKDEPTYYADSVVIAYPTPAGEVDAPAAHPTVTTNNGPVDGSALLDDDLTTMLTIPAPADGSAAWVQFAFEQPFTAQAITLGGRGGSANGIPVGRVLASDDGVTFRSLVALPGEQLYRQGMVRTYAFAPITAKFYRIELTGAPLGPAETMSQAPSSPAAQYVLSETILHGGARVQRWQEKAGFSFLFEYNTVPTPAVPAVMTVPPGAVLTLTSQMQPDGTLTWKVPPGTWTVLRLGYSLTGAKNRPATPAGSGLEADKLSRKYMESYYHGYFDPLQEALGPLFGRSLRYVMMDSWEAGTNNWTDDMVPEFTRRRGYDPTRYLPALTGQVVDNADASDRFLWDFRRTLADMWADNHYGTMADALHAHGIGVYAEAAGVSLEMAEDTLLNKSKVDIPMGEFWVHDLHPHLMYLQDVRGAASAAHAYGKPIVAAEAFTGGGFESPAALKNVADYWLAQGVNRLVFHTSAHQPLGTKPGNTMVGTHLNRNITWAEQAAPFVTYLSRACYLLQQGMPVADLAYLLNEGAPSTPPIWAAGTQPTPPAGFDYDFINADVLLHRMSVAPDGRLVLPDGMSYRVLVLPQTDKMRPELLRKIQELVRGGATVIGPKPMRSPSLAGYPTCDDQVRRFGAEVWGDLDGVSRTMRRCGNGMVIWGWPLDRVMAMLHITPDFASSRGLDTNLVWTHRRHDHLDIYLVANLTGEAQDVDARFRVAGRAAEIWHPDTGAIEEAGYAITGDRTVVPLSLTAHESVFVVFRKPAVVASRREPRLHIETLATIAGPWDVRFPPGLGAPAQARFPELASWTEQPDEGVRYFSGTATYTKTVPAPAAWFRDDAHIWLDLGVVRDLAEVRVNGHALGILWKPPYRVDVTNALRSGENQFEIKVTNEWTNRLLGDRAAPPGRKILNSPVRVGGFGGNRGVSDSAPELPPSGLLGPVTIQLQSP